MIKEEEYDKIEKTLYYEPFGDITYVVVGAEKCGAKENPLDIMRRIISRQADGVITETSRRTCSYPTDGGKNL